MISNRAVQWGLSLSQPQKESVASTSVPAPTGGVDARGPLMSMGADRAILMYNMYPSEYGCRVRKGFIEWANGAGLAADLTTVRTIMPYISSSNTFKLFAVTNLGIYDITSSTTAPVLVVDYGAVGGWVTTGSAGYCSFEQYTTIGGTNYLLVADEANGYFYYDGTTWTTAPTLTGGATDPKTVSFLKVWKHRIWLGIENTGTAVYLGTSAVSGPCTAFQFGNKFSRGGGLKGLYSYTRDGGDGIDDFLVVISNGGDVLLYQGFDPDVATSFFLQGSWYVGDMPLGSRIAAAFGGDLVILSAYGLLPVSKLVAGKSIAAPDFYLTADITRLVRDIMETDRESRGWDVIVHPSDGLIIVNTPKRENYDFIQFVADINRGAWGVWRGVPMHCAAVFRNKLYFGTEVF